MDLNTITGVLQPSRVEEAKNWQKGDARVAGGTWLFSEAQASTHTLIDPASLSWPSLTVSSERLEIGGTCKIAKVNHFAELSRVP